MNDIKARKKLYNLRYYARKRGYYFDKRDRIVTTPADKRLPRIEARLESFGYGIIKNLFYND